MTAPIFTCYDDAANHQLREWTDGRPWHNPWSPGATVPAYGVLSAGECCPDFSCCAPDAIWPRERRISFVAASAEVREGMLFGALVNLTDPDKVYVAGGAQ